MCGSEHGVDACPAKGRTCNNCGKQNHFAKVCRQSTRKQQKPRIQFVNQNNLNESSSSGSIWIVKQAKAAINYISKFFMPFVAIFLSQTWINICVDTGAQANIIDEKTFNQLKLKPKLRKTSVKLYRYNDTRPIELLGEFKTRVMYNNQYRSVTFIVVKGNAGNLLSYMSAVELGIVNKIKSINTVTVKDDCKTDPVVQQWKAKMPELFTGRVGCLKDFEAKLHIDPNVKPVQQKTAPCPVSSKRTSREGDSKDDRGRSY
jgi:hypothetical protein